MKLLKKDRLFYGIVKGMRKQSKQKAFPDIIFR